MRLIALLPFLCALVAFILSILCIFAGSKPGFMENYDLMTLNTSMLGQNVIANLSTPSGGSGLLGELEGELSSLEQDLKNDLNSAVHSLAQALQIHDWYSYHIMDFCEGYYEPGAIQNATVDPWKNVTACSNATGGFSFNLTQVLQSQLKSGINLSDLQYPQQINDVIALAEAAVNVMFIFYCIGVALSGLAFLGAIPAFFTDGRLSACLDGVTAFVAAIALTVASGIVTFLVDKIVDGINQYGSKVNIAAYKGTGFLGMTWAATALMYLAAIGWMVDCCIGPSRRRKSHV